MEGKDREQKYQGNAYRNIQLRERSKEKNKKEEAKPIAQGKLQKPTIRQRLTDSFLAASGEDIKDRVIFDWIIPGIKNIVEDIVHVLLFGDKSDPRILRSRGESRLGDVRYSKYYKDRRGNDEYIPKPRTRDPVVTFPSRDRAEAVMTGMIDELAKYGRVTVKDLYIMSNLGIPTDFAMSNWGWRDLTGISVVQARDGYMIKLPKVEELK